MTLLARSLSRAVWRLAHQLGRLAAALLVAVRLGADGQAASDYSAWSGETMGTTYTIKIAGPHLEEASLAAIRETVEKCLDEVNRQMSHYRPDSELSRFNQHRSTEPFPVSPWFARVTRYAIELHRQSQGAFDPALGPLINLWGFGQAGQKDEAPKEAELEQARRVCGCQYLSITPGDELVKTIRELEVNLSAVAKGFAVDEAARLLRGRGFTNLMVEIGGEVVASGLNHEGQKWRIGIQTPAPEAPPGEALEGVVRLSGRALATSGDYRRFYVDARQGRYSHILNPKTGRPVLHNLASVSVVADDCLTADGLATTLFVLGLPDGLRWIESRTNSAALFIVRESEGKFRRVLSSRFATMTAFEP